MTAFVDTCGRHGERQPCKLCPTIRAVDIRPQPVEWLSDGTIPRSMVTVFTGLPGVGKSTIDFDLAARTSRNGEAVLILTAEDHHAAVVRPRLEAAGADLDLVHVVIVDITLPDDVTLIGELIREHDAALVLVDPLVAFIGDGVNTHRDHHVRRVLSPLGKVAEETGAAIVVVIHSNKGTIADPLMRISGSVGFGGAARTVVVAADDPKDDSRRIFAVIKSNVAEKPTPLAYRLVGVQLQDNISTSRVEWLGPAPEVDIRELLGTPERGERQTDKARAFLLEAGVMEQARPAAELEAEADEIGINYRTLRRAADELAIPKWKERGSLHGAWWWGPRPDEGDKPRGHPTLVQLSPSGLPAETVPEEDKGDNDVEAGVAAVDRFITEGIERGFVCVRCTRYGLDHSDGHIESWSQVDA